MVPLATPQDLDFLQTHPYVAAFASLFLCGTVLPVPEELLLVAVGYTVHSGVGRLDLMILCAFLGVVGSDLLIFGAGRLLGTNILGMRWLRILISPRRKAFARRMVDRHGPKAIIFVRPLSLVRWFTYFLLGSLRLGFQRFVLYDALGAMATVALAVGAGYYFGEEIDVAVAFARRSGLGAAAVAAVALVVFLIVRQAGAPPRTPEGEPASEACARGPESGASLAQGGPSASDSRMQA